MPLASDKARSVVVGALRAKFPQDKALGEDELIEKFKAQDQLKRLEKYYGRIQAWNDSLDRQLLNAG